MKLMNWVLALCAGCGIIFAGTAAAAETYWELDGNAAAGWLGTTNANPLTLKVNNTVGWRLLKSTGTPNVVGGYNGNTVSAIEGATIGGGGYGIYPNNVTGAFGTVAGGVKNSAGDRATVAGGTSNTASGIRSAVGGGYYNVASGQYASVGGGSYNAAKADYTTVAGGGPSSPLDPTATNNRAVDTYCTIGGGGRNRAGSDDGVTTNASWATVAGGFNNWATYPYSTVGGGNLNTAEGDMATISGGMHNDSEGVCATVGGGRCNIAYGQYATISGGGPNPDDGSGGFDTNNRASDDYCTVGGGYFNRSGDSEGLTTTARYATVAGGRENQATADSSTVGGGWSNLASASFATIAGGGAAALIGKADEKDTWVSNRATDQYCTVGGGGANLAGSDDEDPDTAIIATVGGGQFNVADHFAATVSGGYVNEASGNYATVPGGAGNLAQGEYSFAAGRNAHATADGAFAWADSSGSLFTNSTTNRFAARASGGVYFYTNSAASTGVYVGAGGTGWNVISDRNAKENLTEVSPEAVLDKVAALPISTWDLKDGDAKVRHMGPMAQDLYAAFGLGDSDKSINSVDADGIALASIQGLNKKLEDQNRKQGTEIAALRGEIETLKSMIRQMAQK